MDAISVGPGASFTVTPAGVQTVQDIPWRSVFQVASAAISVVGATNHYLAAAGTWRQFHPGDVIDVAGFVAGGAVNSGRKRVSSVTSTQLFVTDTALIDEAAGPAVTFDRLQFPREIMIMATSAVPKVNLWQFDGGAPPAATTAIFVGTGGPLFLRCDGYTAVVVDGASGSVSITPLDF